MTKIQALETMLEDSDANAAIEASLAYLKEKRPDLLNKNNLP